MNVLFLFTSPPQEITATASKPARKQASTFDINEGKED